MFRTRLISGIALVAIILALILPGGPVLAIGLLAISLIGMFELYRAVGLISKEGIALPSFAGFAGAAALFILLLFDQTQYLMVSAALTTCVLLAIYVFSWPKVSSTAVMQALFGLFYVAVMLSYIFRTRSLPGGEYLVWFIFFCSWGCDTCAYCVGMLIGKHKMSPKLSPKKSIEGAVGGVLGAAGLGALYAFILGARMPEGISIPEAAIICAAGALISMVGDLAASAIKREHQIKDYGRLIPGHGGILDRFDSVIITAPLIWLLSKLLGA